MLISFVVALIISAIVILIVSKLGLGLQATGFVGAFVAALVIAVVTAIVMWVLDALGITFGSGIVGAILMILVSAGVLMFSDKFAPGIKVNGWTGAIVAAIAIGVLNWLISLIF